MPDLNNEEIENITTENLLRSWPDHFNEAIKILNWHLLPALKFLPKEIILGLVVNTKPSSTSTSTIPTTEPDAVLQMAYIAQ